VRKFDLAKLGHRSGLSLERPWLEEQQSRWQQLLQWK